LNTLGRLTPYLFPLVVSIWRDLDYKGISGIKLRCVNTGGMSPEQTIQREEKLLWTFSWRKDMIHLFSLLSPYISIFSFEISIIPPR